LIATAILSLYTYYNMARCTIRPLLHSNINFKTDGASRWSAQSIIKIMTAQHSFVHTVLYLATIVGWTSFHKAACNLDTKSVKISLQRGLNLAWFQQARNSNL